MGPTRPPRARRFASLHPCGLFAIGLALGGCGAAPHADESPRDETPTERVLRGAAACAEGAPGTAEEAAAEALDEEDPARAEGHARACELGDWCGCDALAELVADTEPERARTLRARACEGGLERACVSLAIMLRSGEGGASEPRRAARLFEAACAAGEAEGCAGHGDVLANDPSDASQAAARAAYRTACDGEVAWGCYRAAELSMGLLGAAGTSETDRAATLAAAARDDAFACERGVAVACTHLGRMRASGWGGPTDLAAAAALYVGACDGGEAWACTYLGQLLLAGEGVAADETRAREELTRVCSGGNGMACRSLALAMRGEERASQLTHACSLGDRIACDAAALPPAATAIPSALGGDAATGPALRPARGSRVASAEVRAGAEVELSALALRPTCVGRVGATPVAAVTVERGVTQLRLRLAALADTVLVVRGPDGVFQCATDADGGRHAAQLLLPVRAGQALVWAGVAGEGEARATLEVESLAGRAR